MIAKGCYQIWKWAGKGVPQLHASYWCLSMVLFLRHLLTYSPHSWKIFHLLLWNYVFQSMQRHCLMLQCSLLQFFFFSRFSFHTTVLKFFILESMKCSFLVYQYYNSLILTVPPPPPIRTWPNLHHHPPVPLVATVPGSLEHILAVPKHGCLGASNDTCRLDHGACHLFHSTTGLQWESGHVFLSTSLSSVLVYFCSSNISFLQPSVLCWQCQSYVKLSSFSPKPFPEKMPERCASKERLKSLVRDQWCLESGTIFCIFKKWEQGKGSHRIFCWLKLNSLD